MLAGGHTIEDEEPKFGLSVTGLVHPDQVWTNAGARPGDALVLTKPIGSGVLFNANLKGWVSEEALATPASRSITTLNKTAAEVAARLRRPRRHRRHRLRPRRPRAWRWPRAPA